MTQDGPESILQLAWNAVRANLLMVALCLAGGVICVIGIMVDLGPLNFPRANWTVLQAVACLGVMGSAKQYYFKKQVQASSNALASERILMGVLAIVFLAVCALTSVVVSLLAPPRIAWGDVSFVSAGATGLACILAFARPASSSR